MNHTETSKLEQELRQHVEELGQRIDAINREVAGLEVRRKALIETRMDLIDMLSRNGGAQ